MPCFRIFTNVASEKITDELILKASKFFTDSIKKPEQWITIHFVGDQKMSFAGSVEPCAQIYVMSIGNLGVDENQRISAEVLRTYRILNSYWLISQIAGFIEENLGIPKNRAYIEFNDAPKDVVGWNGTTFQTIL